MFVCMHVYVCACKCVSISVSMSACEWMDGCIGRWVGGSVLVCVYVSLCEYVFFLREWTWSGWTRCGVCLRVSVRLGVRLCMCQCLAYV